MIRVVNKNAPESSKNGIYCGRGSPLGNPYRISIYEDRDAVIEKFKTYLVDKISKKDKIICEQLNKIYKEAKNGDVDLVCFCAPKRCHCDVIKEIIESKLYDKTTT